MIVGKSLFLKSVTKIIVVCGGGSSNILRSAFADSPEPNPSSSASKITAVFLPGKTDLK